ncbi:sensor histidine kinase [Micromonosporaceae bacterium Da 78-11]
MRAPFDDIQDGSQQVIQTGDIVQFLELRRTCLLARYRNALSEPGAPGATDERWRETCVHWADTVITEALSRLAVTTGPGTAVVLDPAGPQLDRPSTVPEDPTRAGFVELTDLVAASTILFDCFGKHLKEYADMHSQTGAAVLAVSTALHTALMARLGEMLLARSRALLAETHRTQRVERLRLGRDIHDRLGNSVVGARQSLELFTTYRSADPGGAERQLRRTQDLLDEALDVLPGMISEVRAETGLRHLGTALREYAATATDSQVRIDVRGDEALLTELVRTETFLIVREALRNALRHSHCLFAAVEIHCRPQSLFCSIEDDGIGFDAQTVAADENRHGLQSMQERARLLGGFLRVRSRIGHGTRVELHVPLTGATRP